MSHYSPRFCGNLINFYTDKCDYAMPIDVAVKMYSNKIRGCNFYSVGKGILKVVYYTDVVYFYDEFIYWGQDPTQLKKLLEKREFELIKNAIGYYCCDRCIKLIQKGTSSFIMCKHQEILSYEYLCIFPLSN